MTTEHLVSFRDETLERLRALLIFQGQVASPAFDGLVDALENDALAQALRAVAQDAPRQQRELEAIIERLLETGRGDAPRHPRARDDPPVSHRDIVESWMEITETAAQVYRHAAAQVGDADARLRLERLAAMEEHHARMFRNLL